MRLLALLLALCAGTAHAHKPSDSYLALQADAAGVSGQWDIALRDLEHAIGLDADGDGAITWGTKSAAEAAASQASRREMRCRFAFIASSAPPTAACSCCTNRRMPVSVLSRSFASSSIGRSMRPATSLSVSSM